MRRLIAFIALLIVVAATGYAVFWYQMAARVRGAVLDWAEAQRQLGHTIGWDRMTVGGFPLWIEVRLEAPLYRAATREPNWEASLPRLIGEARPWRPQDWVLSGPEGGRLFVAPGTARGPLTAEAARIHGRADGAAPANPPTMAAGTRLSLVADTIAITGDFPANVERLALTTMLDRAAERGAELRLERLTWTGGASLFEREIAELALAARVTRAMPEIERASLMRWRENGGTVELDRLRLVWGPLSVRGNGTLALDDALQPIGAFSGRVQGHAAIIDALVARRSMRAGDGALAKIGLGLLSKTGADGRPEIEAPITLQNGQLYLGPVRLGTVPRFTWD